MSETKVMIFKSDFLELPIYSNPVLKTLGEYQTSIRKESMDKLNVKRQKERVYHHWGFWEYFKIE